MRALSFALGAAAAAAQGFGPINNLPGYSGSAKMESGYITVNAINGRALFYWLVQAVNGDAKAPLVFWTNGGPGCSSLGGGLFSEHGPFRPQADGTLADNPFSWHLAPANMLYVEQPAGVGFSYSNTTSDYTVGDQRSWSDMYWFIQGFLASHPQYATTDFWITGESYGGHYVPGFAAYVVQQNMLGVNPKVPLKGFMVGNAWTDAFFDNTGAVEQWYGFGQISNDSYTGILRTCNMSDVGPLFTRSRAALDVSAFEETVDGARLRVGAAGFKSARPVNGALPTWRDQTCDQWQAQASGEQGNVDIYDLYSNVCTGSNAVENITLSVGGDSNVQAGCAADYNPCIDTLTAAYLNRADVQKALHVVPALVPGGQWVGCTSVVNYSYADLLSSMLPVYAYLLSAFPAGRFLVYSGDVDGIVPRTGTRDWLASLALPPAPGGAFKPWNTAQGQVAGYTYALAAPSGATLVFASIRNAGHLCPTLQGSRSLQMFTSFLNDGVVA